MLRRDISILEKDLRLSDTDEESITSEFLAITDSEDEELHPDFWSPSMYMILDECWTLKDSYKSHLRAVLLFSEYVTLNLTDMAFLP